MEKQPIQLNDIDIAKVQKNIKDSGLLTQEEITMFQL